MSDLIARVMAQRRVLVWLGVAALAGVCLGILVMRIELDSDVINMLPNGFESVRGLKIYDRDFEQTRELTFALRCQPQDVDRLEEFAPTFADNLRKQPWCERVLAGSPMESADGIRDLQLIAVPLLLNLEPAAFEQTAARQIRFERLRAIRMGVFFCAARQGASISDFRGLDRLPGQHGPAQNGRCSPAAPGGGQVRCQARALAGRFRRSAV